MEVSSLVANFTGGARANLYKVEIDGIDGKLQFVCKAAQLPGKNINPIEVPYLNNTLKVAGDPTFDDLSITILNDEDYLIRHQIEQWMEGIKNNARAVGAETSSDYFRQVHVIQLGRDGEELDNAHYVFYNAWPSSLAAVDLGFDSKDTITESSVTIAYSHWELA